MTDHRPECPWPDKPCGPDHEPMHDREPMFCVACLTECICEQIKRAERRVLDALDLAGANVKYQGIGFAAGLDAAREAVWEWIGYTFPGHRPSWTVQIPAAIDALREEKS